LACGTRQKYGEEAVNYKKYVQPYLSTLAVVALGVLVYALPPKVTTVFDTPITVVSPQVTPIPAEPTPDDVEPSRAFVLRNGKPLSDADAKPFIEAFKRGDGELVYHGYAKDRMIVRKMVITGGNSPVVPSTPSTPTVPTVPSTPVTPEVPSKIVGVTYYYEKDSTAVPSFVQVSLNRINRENPGIRATSFEDDTTNGMDNVPAPHRIALAKSRELGQPVVIARDASGNVIKSIKSPKSEAEFMEVLK
jgi:hypothetical protein